MNRTISVTVRKVGRVWKARWRDPVSGKDRQRSLGCKDKAVALQAAREIEKQLAAGQLGLTMLKTYDTTVEKAVELFLADQAVRNRHDTVVVYTSVLNRFAAFAKAKKVTKLSVVTADMIHSFATSGEKVRVTRTKNKDLRHVRTLMRWAADESRQLIAKAPKIKLLREDEKSPVVVPNEHLDKVLATLAAGEVVLLHCSTEWWRVFVTLLYATGARKSELLQLKWSRIDLAAGVVMVEAITSKSRRTRLVPLLADTVALLKTWQLQADAEYVIPWMADPTAIYDEWDKVIAAAKVPYFRFKDCRSSVGSQMIQSGEPLPVVAEFLGHTNPMVTLKHYVNAKPVLRGAAERRAAMLRAVDTPVDTAPANSGV